MSPVNLSPQFQVVLGLQKQTLSKDIGSYTADVAERAILYALSPTRNPSGAFLRFDVLRDARKSVGRGRRREREVNAKVHSIIERGGRVAGIGTIDWVTPETEYLGNELEQRIHDAVAVEGPVAIRCLEGLIDGESIGETAAALATSLSSVDRGRKSVRTITRALLDEDDKEVA